MTMKTTKVQRDASTRWNEKNKARKYYLAKRSMARSYCRVATKEDLEALIAFANEKLAERFPE
ncbi:hypothetical protein [Ligilactobacillus murinus]|uniref:Uncharacterized protein n=1 Tax=Ligilactobacillus murinus TaxID=1622 RepID=A0AAE6WKJ5_9LACO|nr:hypothetical protein [Ligilactobacillus murinus]NEF83226.1 hypothetical protein [Ligilactobacillus murinus]NEF85378.1 hypothetical protein [Ligilactobacillus murinus]NEF90075.1 hypothetical protein [Ligilactobacillus murinus]NEF92346.1 hypothetical protein [Ligilactobacillus murinus]NEF97406.1 hypothetical protein [Ligilactobacillus murinus]